MKEADLVTINIYKSTSSHSVINSQRKF